VTHYLTVKKIIRLLFFGAEKRAIRESKDAEI